LKNLNENPIIFAMANPEPEIRPELAKKIRPDCIIATGRSDYPNQINNVMCFPFLFRATLDVRASQINENMKMAAAKALAALAKAPVPIEVKNAYPSRTFEFGREYIIPTPFDPRLIENICVEVAKAAVESGIAKNPIKDYDHYRI
jgi:malate dehydrogenase (oxaloacetate-decarboxylating)(NADP+)